ncbi:MAG TPA: transcription elongation factor GreA, partial [Spirochaetia bacterium]|nr:transcription elongation factor GreA [Spirochaetia bacterium]
RREIITCYRKKYSYHSQLEDYIRLSNLTQSWRNVHDAIGDFEKHISFDAGAFVFHRAWGIGRISVIKDDEIEIDFARKRGHTMSLKMAVGSLQSLPHDHIWVLKAIWKKDKLHDQVKSEIPWALKTIIKSYGNSANMKQIKSELVPGVLTAGEWAGWSTEARRILKTDSNFGNLPDKVDDFVVREKPISFDEKTFNKFKAEKSFFVRFQTFQDLLKHSDPESDYFAEMFAYFTAFLKSWNTVNETIMAAFLVVRRIVKRFPFLNPGFSYEFPELFEKVEDLEGTFRGIEDPDLKRDFLEQVKRHIEDWPGVFVRLFPYYLSRFIIDELEEAKRGDLLNGLFAQIADQYKEYREAFVWMAKTFETPMLERYSLHYEKILIGMIHLLDITYREINNRRDVSNNRKLNKQIQTFLFKENRLEGYILSAEKESVERLFTLVEDVKDLDPSIAIGLKHKIMDKYPDFKFYGEKEAERVRGGLYVTAPSLEKKQRELQHILDVEVPDNSKEIGAAIQLGDLSENAEYKAAKERQEMLGTTVARLKEEIDRAQIFGSEMIDASKVSFGTKVTLFNKKTGKTEEFTILGPWESDPAKNIVSYLSPFVSKLWNHKEGEELSFVINDREYEYEVKEITPAGI